MLEGKERALNGRGNYKVVILRLSVCINIMRGKDKQALSNENCAQHNSVSWCQALMHMMRGVCNWG
jgi:hypothetical protein